MNTTYKPEGFSTVSPYLIVQGAASTMNFLEMLFGAIKVREIPDPTGRIMHAEVRIEDSVIMVTDGAPGWPPIPSHVHIYVKDVDETYVRALQLGAISVQEPIKRGGDENKRGAFKDSGGTTWWIATKVE